MKTDSSKRKERPFCADFNMVKI